MMVSRSKVAITNYRLSVQLFIEWSYVSTPINVSIGQLMNRRVLIFRAAFSVAMIDRMLIIVVQLIDQQSSGLVEC